MQKDLPVWLSEMNTTSLPPTSNANIAIFDKVLEKYQTKWTGSGMVLGGNEFTDSDPFELLFRHLAALFRMAIESMACNRMASHRSFTVDFAANARWLSIRCRCRRREIMCPSSIETNRGNRGCSVKNQ
jgi:hypothetical protein